MMNLASNQVFLTMEHLKHDTFLNLTTHVIGMIAFSPIYQAVFEVARMEATMDDASRRRLSGSDVALCRPEAVVQPSSMFAAMVHDSSIFVSWYHDVTSSNLICVD